MERRPREVRSVGAERGETLNVGAIRVQVGRGAGRTSHSYSANEKPRIRR